VKLLPSVGIALLITVLLSRVSMFARAQLAGVVVALLLSYGFFCAVVFAMGLDSDDRLIADAIWARARSLFGRTP